MLSVVFQQPIILDAANLHSLLSLANAPAVVTPYADPTPVEETPVKATRVRKPKAVAEGGTATEAPVVDKPKRTRATKAEMEARRAAEQPAEEPETPAPEKAEAKGRGKGKASTANGASTPEYAQKLLDRFAVLIDKDFDVASGLLAEFGVKRFSEMKPEQHSAFDAKLTGAGV